MRIHWTALGVGVIVGAVVGFCAARMQGAGAGQYGLPKLGQRLGVIR